MPRARTVALVLLAPVSWVAGVWLVGALIERIPALGSLVWLDPSEVRTPLGLLGVTALVLALDIGIQGWNASAARRLFVAPSRSAQVDVFYLIMRAAGGLHVLAFAFSFGTVYWAARQIHSWFDIGLLRDTSWVVQFVAVYLVHSLVFYWAHRLMHTRALWTIHKVHHAAEELNIVTPLRNHPIDLMVMTVLHVGPSALLGATPEVVLLHAGVNAIYQAVVHSEWRLPGRRWDTIWITPAAHRLHHSDRPEHFDHNFGILTVWDRLFGTYLPPDAPSASSGSLTYGVDDGALFNRPEHLRELLANIRRWRRGLSD